MQNRDKLIYNIVTGLFSLLIMMGVGMYIFQHDMVAGMFTDLKYPTYLIYPLALVKTLGIIAIWTNYSKMLKEWAYAGFVFELILGVSAHLAVNDGEFGGAMVALLLVIVSYIYSKRLDK